MTASFHNQDIFELPAERIALNGYRLTMAGYEHGDASCWDELWTSLVADAGLPSACDLSGIIHHFVRSLRFASNRPLQYYPKACRRACADECLVVALLSACQNGDTATKTFCLQRLAGLEHPPLAADVSHAAVALSTRLTATGQLLLPVPLAVIADIVKRSCANCTLATNCLH
jgi:hypothetical protein